MSFNGSGTFDPPAPPNYPAVSGEVIYASRFNAALQEIFDGLSQCIVKDGQQVLTGPINFSNQKILNANAVVVGTETHDGTHELQVVGEGFISGGLGIGGSVGDVVGALQPSSETTNSFRIMADPSNVGSSSVLEFGVDGNALLNLTSGRRLTADFSNATFSNRLAFQTSTSNSSTGVGVMPNGSGTGGFWNTFNSSDPNNAAVGQFLCNNTGVTVNSTVSGTGVQLPITFQIAGTEACRVTTSRNFLIGTTTDSGEKLKVEGTGAFTGVLTAPTAAAGTNTTQVATTAFVTTAVSNVVAGAPANLNTLDELAAAINDDPAYSTTVTTALGLKANLASPTFTGTPAAPTASAGTSTTQIATTAFVTTGLNLKANLASPTFTGVPLAPTAASGTNTTQIATTAFVQDAVSGGVGGYAPLASPAFTGTPTAPTAAAATNTTQLATTAFVGTAITNYGSTVTSSLALKANLASPTFTGTPAAPTATAGTNTTQLATTAFVATGLAGLYTEQGTFSPVLYGATSAGTCSYTVRQGRYQRIANRVDFSIHLIWNTHTGTGLMRIALPNSYVHVGSLDSAVATVLRQTGTRIYYGEIGAGDNYISFPFSDVAGTNSSTVMEDFVNGSITVSGTFFV